MGWRSTCNSSRLFCLHLLPAYPRLQDCKTDSSQSRTIGGGEPNGQRGVQRGRWAGGAGKNGGRQQVTPRQIMLMLKQWEPPGHKGSWPAALALH